MQCPPTNPGVKDKIPFSAPAFSTCLVSISILLKIIASSFTSAMLRSVECSL